MRYLSKTWQMKKNDYVMLKKTEEMEHLNTKFDTILEKKREEISQLILLKKPKTKESPIDEVDYSSKAVVSKLKLESDRILKSSKAFKKTQQNAIDQALKMI